MIYYKIGNYVHWIRRLLRGRKVEETVEWIKNDREKMKGLLVNLEVGDDV